MRLENYDGMNDLIFVNKQKFKKYGSMYIKKKNNVKWFALVVFFKNHLQRSFVHKKYTSM